MKIKMFVEVENKYEFMIYEWRCLKNIRMKIYVEYQNRYITRI